VAEILDSLEEAQFMESVAYSSRFLMGESNVQQALLRICDALSAAGIPHAVVDALALGQHGYRRTTEDVDLLLTPEGLARFMWSSLVSTLATANPNPSRFPTPRKSPCAANGYRWFR
jgi:hypothetical protein